MRKEHQLYTMYYAMDHPDRVMPPTVPGLSWRPLQPSDLEAIASLAVVCLEADGGPRWPSAKGHVQELYLPDSPGNSIGAFKKGGQLVACAATKPSHATEEYQVTLVGRVHPAYRRRGFGTYLLKWGIVEASRLLATCPPDRPHVVLLTAESLTEDAAQLFGRHGFVQQSTEHVMRRDLDTPLPDVLIPPEVTLQTWVPASAGHFFAVYQAAFSEQGLPDWSQEEWVERSAGRGDVFPELSLLACYDGTPVGFITCADSWRQGELWIIWLGVRPEWRERGIGSALLVEALRRVQAAGGDYVVLDVDADNPRAARLYKRLGFEGIGQHAEYRRVLTRGQPNSRDGR